MDIKFIHPGIYVDEIFHLPKSVAQVETAVPAFIGYTERAIFKGKDLHSGNTIQPLEINSFAEYETIFGNAPEPASVEFELDNNNFIVSVKTEAFYFLYYSVKLFFDNGGTTCLIVSVDSHSNAAGKVSKQKLLKGLSCLEKTDAATLLVMPDAATLSYAEAAELHSAMLHQSEKMKNRFALLDLVKGNISMNDTENPVDIFRQNLCNNSLSYGAAYYPWLITTWNHKAYGNTFLTAKYYKNGAEVKDLSTLFKQNTIVVWQQYDLFVQKEIRLKQPDSYAKTKTERTAAFAGVLYEYLKEFFNIVSHEAASDVDDSFIALHRNYVAKSSAFHNLVKNLHVMAVRNHLPLHTNNFIADFRPLTFSTRLNFVKERSRVHKHSTSGNLKSLIAEAEQLVSSFFDKIEKLQFSLQEQLRQLDSTYDSVNKAIEGQKVMVPPGGAVAGIIAQADCQRGVWKSPANVNISSVIQPAVDILQFDQETLNVDPVTGKSVNAIRFFQGKGILLYGARTLAGNDNEWRYMNVRRFCIMVEQSVLEAIRPFLFESNNEVTWSRIRIMINNFYNLLWRAGALQGTKPEQAYFVKLGFGETMTATDIDKGIMNLVTGVAVIKPAEFIILTFSQKMMTS